MGVNPIQNLPQNDRTIPASSCPAHIPQDSLSIDSKNVRILVSGSGAAFLHCDVHATPLLKQILERSQTCLVLK